MCDLCVVMDLDDTLYKEREYVKSAFRHIATVAGGNDGGAAAEVLYAEMWGAFCKGKNAFDHAKEQLGLSLPIERLVEMYRTHTPDIVLPEASRLFLDSLEKAGAAMGIISDGRSTTQRNKIAALGLERYISPADVIISEEFGTEKPSGRNYRYFMERYPHISRFVFIGDNPAKDFIAPNKLGWSTIGLLDCDGQNIHPQNIRAEKEAEPQRWIKSIAEALAYM